MGPLSAAAMSDMLLLCWAEARFGAAAALLAGLLDLGAGLEMDGPELGADAADCSCLSKSEVERGDRAESKGRDSEASW